MTNVVGVRFRNAGKIYFFSPGKLEISTGQHVIVETARLICMNRKEGRYRIGRVAVLMEYRKMHLGSRLMQELEDIAKANGARIMEVSAQCRAQKFYESCGYNAHGQTYDDEGCPHIRMEKNV